MSSFVSGFCFAEASSVEHNKNATNKWAVTFQKTLVLVGIRPLPTQAPGFQSPGSV
jgi:hypothetical protein